MAKDFAHRHSPRPSKDSAPNAPAKARGAVPKQEEQPANFTNIFNSLPAWGWLLLGLIAGFLLSELSRLAFDDTSAVIATNQVAANSTTNTAPSNTSAPKKTTPAPRFDFYTLLPESEVEAPQVEAYKSTPRTAVNQPKYLLQVGSFRSTSDAAKLQARLQDLGFENIKINSVDTENAGTWYRVQLGPYQDRRELARTQNNLAKLSFDFIQLRLSEEPLTQENSTP